jgi:hypothetical protein
MATGHTYSLDCGKHSNQVDAVLNHIIESTGVEPCRRQDGNCHDDFSVAVGSRFLQFHNIPDDIYPAFLEAAENAKANLLAKVA